MAKTTKYSGSQTEKNLEAAFAGESQARNKYTYFASVAKKQGFEQIANLFLKTADNEKEHAKMWFKELNGIGDTAENLLAAAEGENKNKERVKEQICSCADGDGAHTNKGISLCVDKRIHADCDHGRQRTDEIEHHIWICID